MVLSALADPISAVIRLLLGVEARELSFAARWVVLVACGVGLLGVLVAKQKIRLPMLALGFLALYLLRMVLDQGRFEKSDEDLLYYLAGTLIPAVSVAVMALAWNDQKVARTCAIVGMATCAMILVVSLTDVASWRSTTEVSAGRLSYDILNPIAIGNVGAMTAIASACLLLEQRRWWTIVGLAAGLVVLGLSLSRGPLVSLGACLAAYFFVTRRWRLLALMGAALVGVTFTDGFQEVLRSLRLDDLGHDAASAERLIVLRYAFAAIGENPLFGTSYLEPITGLYPHNLFVDAALALGIGGLLALIWISARSLMVGVWGMRRGDVFLPMVLVYWLVEAQFSGAVWSNSMFWLPAVIVLAHAGLVRSPAPFQLQPSRC